MQVKLRSVIGRVLCKASQFKYYALEPFNPVVPNRVGTRYFRRRSRWKLDQRLCNCDVAFTQYLEHEGYSGKTIFHFGSGDHHHVGRRCSEVGVNEVLALTASAREHKSYVDLVIKNPRIACTYKVIFLDIYTLTPNIIPNFDLVTLFHLFEFTPSEKSANPLEVLQDDRSLIQLLIKKLKPGGRILFYTGSFGWPKTKEVLVDLTAQGQIEKIEDYEGLVVYKARSVSELDL